MNGNLGVRNGNCGFDQVRVGVGKDSALGKVDEESCMCKSLLELFDHAL